MARPSLHLPKCQIVGNLMPPLIIVNIEMPLRTTSLNNGPTMGGSRGSNRARTPNPPKNHKAIGFLSNTDRIPCKIHAKATKPAFNVEPSSARQRNAISMAFRQWAYDGPL